MSSEQMDLQVVVFRMGRALRFASLKNFEADSLGAPLT
jgi:hypothetical protein